jgi:hypothetical protein
MKPFAKSLVIAAVQIALVASLGGKLLYDRATRPRVWALTAPYDPDLPIRGRYVSLRLLVEPRGIDGTSSGSRQSPRPVVLHVEDDGLIADASPVSHEPLPSDLHVRLISGRNGVMAILEEPVAFFIPEHVPDPSRRPLGEELWVEVTVPRKGPPRPIRLGVRTGDGPIMPMALR